MPCYKYDSKKLFVKLGFRCGGNWYFRESRRCNLANRSIRYPIRLDSNKCLKINTNHERISQSYRQVC